MRAAALSVVALVLSMSRAAAAAPAEAPEAGAVPQEAAPRELPRLKRPSLAHTMQFGIALLPGTGYRVLFPYQETTPCERPEDFTMLRRVCTARLPFFLDVQVSFGFARSWDLLVDVRFGIEKDFTEKHQIAFAPGLRYWVDPGQPTKFFATIQAAIDTTSLPTPLDKSDFGVRNANGFMFEVMRNFGVYVQLGETLGFRRWLRFEIDGGVGVQARFP